MYKKAGTPKGVPAFCLAAVLVLVVVLILVVILVVVLVLVVLVVILILVLVLVIHSEFLRILYCGQCRLHSFPRISEFIPCLKEKAGDETCCDGSSDPAGTGLQPAGKDPQKALVIHSFLNAFGKVRAEACQRY